MTKSRGIRFEGLIAVGLSLGIAWAGRAWTQQPAPGLPPEITPTPSSEVARDPNPGPRKTPSPAPVGIIAKSMGRKGVPTPALDPVPTSTPGTPTPTPAPQGPAPKAPEGSAPTPTATIGPVRT